QGLGDRPCRAVRRDQVVPQGLDLRARRRGPSRHLCQVRLVDHEALLVLSVPSVLCHVCHLCREVQAGQGVLLGRAVLALQVLLCLPEGLEVLQGTGHVAPYTLQ
uniref:Uncharacterized protein n=1 Tax=Parascaris univalens TaxID=6257 RepID=A0A915AH04_PARUN